MIILLYIMDIFHMVKTFYSQCPNLKDIKDVHKHGGHGNAFQVQEHEVQSASHLSCFPYILLPTQEVRVYFVAMNTLWFALVRERWTYAHLLYHTCNQVTFSIHSTTVHLYGEPVISAYGAGPLKVNGSWRWATHYCINQDLREKHHTYLNRSHTLDSSRPRIVAAHMRELDLVGVVTIASRVCSLV